MLVLFGFSVPDVDSEHWDQHETSEEYARWTLLLWDFIRRFFIFTDGEMLLKQALCTYATRRSIPDRELE